MHGPFHRVTWQTNAATDFLFAFTGREWDRETDLYYYRARYYDAVLGRFLSEDPLGFAAGDGNLTRYVENNPMENSDPTGQIPFLGNNRRRREHNSFLYWFFLNIRRKGEYDPALAQGDITEHRKDIGKIVTDLVSKGSGAVLIEDAKQIPLDIVLAPVEAAVIVGAIKLPPWMKIAKEGGKIKDWIDSLGPDVDVFQRKDYIVRKNARNHVDGQFTVTVILDRRNNHFVVVTEGKLVRNEHKGFEHFLLFSTGSFEWDKNWTTKIDETRSRIDSVEVITLDISNRAQKY